MRAGARDEYETRQNLTELVTEWIKFYDFSHLWGMVHINKAPWQEINRETLNAVTLGKLRNFETSI